MVGNFKCHPACTLVNAERICYQFGIKYRRISHIFGDIGECIGCINRCIAVTCPACKRIVILCGTFFCKTFTVISRFQACFNIFIGFKDCTVLVFPFYRVSVYVFGFDIGNAVIICSGCGIYPLTVCGIGFTGHICVSRFSVVECNGCGAVVVRPVELIVGEIQIKAGQFHRFPIVVFFFFTSDNQPRIALVLFDTIIRFILMLSDIYGIGSMASVDFNRKCIVDGSGGVDVE